MPSSPQGRIARGPGCGERRVDLIVTLRSLSTLIFAGRVRSSLQDRLTTEEDTSVNIEKNDLGRSAVPSDADTRPMTGSRAPENRHVNIPGPVSDLLNLRERAVHDLE